MRVAKHKVEVQFLLKGLVRTSRVSLLPDRISFGTVVVGKRSEQVICISNDEDISMRFVFDNALMQGMALQISLAFALLLKRAL